VAWFNLSHVAAVAILFHSEEAELKQLAAEFQIEEAEQRDERNLH